MTDPGDRVINRLLACKKGKNKMKRFMLFALLLICISGCDVDFNASIRSGNVDDDYVEEPLSAFSKKYANALKVSNQAVKSIKNKDYDFLYNTVLSEDLRGLVTKEALEQGIEQTLTKFGEIKEYKEMQWHFIPKDEEIGPVVYSVKIVKHENVDVNYVFVFRNDGEFKNIIAIHSLVKTGVVPPGQI